ncbi:SH3 domain-containing protein [Cellulosilyticum sp. I15G10I2]|uniref:SH3 domain-containing protein n=1 Tax=Cellulosilyticum sp. I15G10I2 TaxID=1892843 RepID=UPI00085C1930|nr:SH3 domain-containing protein [Cellulosilyticum sp. I15G10I2]
MRLKHKMLAWVAVSVISIGSMNTFASHIAMIGEETAILTKQNGQKATLKLGDKVKVLLDENFHQSSTATIDMDGTYGYIEKKDIQMQQIQTKVLTDNVYVRKEPSTVAEVVVQLNKDERLIAYHKYTDWYFVETISGKTGYIYASHINEENLYLLQRKDIHIFNTKAAQALAGQAVKGDFYTGERLNKDPEAAENIAVIAEKLAVLITKNQDEVLLKAGDRIKMILDEDFHQNTLAQVDMNGTYGYIDKKDIQMQQIQTRILTDGAFLRKSPAPNGEVVKKLDKDEVVTAYYKYVDWYFVEREDGQQGFIYKSQINESKLYLLKRKSNMNELNIFLGKGAPVEVVTWSEASKILPRGGNAVIEDVYTGKSFNIKRTFGSNHADIETLTKADTEIMKQIWGGFTWERRPVIVHVAGRRLAASVAGMPHAGKDSAPNLAYVGGRSAGYGYGINLDAVKGNGMDGHFDLHFRGSRRHADGRIRATVDSVHQAAIDIAAKYK